MKLNLINWDSETSKPLIKNNFSSDVRKAFSKWQLKKYLTDRVLKKWNDFDYLTKSWSVIDQTVDRGSDFINANQKAFSLKWLSMIWNWADAVFDKIWNTHLKDDDREFAALKIFVENAKNDLNSQNITSKDITTIEAKLAEMLKKFFNNNFFRSSMQINENDIDWYIKDIISSWNEEKQIVAMRRMWASRTWFDNSQTAFLRDDIFDMHTRKKKQKVKE